MFPLLIPLLLGGGAVLVATQVSRKRRRGEGVPPAVTRADPFEGYDQWGTDPIRQSPGRAEWANEPVAPTRVRVLRAPEPEVEYAVPVARTPERARGPRRPRPVGPQTPAPRRELPSAREVEALPDDVLDEDGLSEDFNAHWARVSRGS